jgi:hypothetical protein
LASPANAFGTVPGLVIGSYNGENTFVGYLRRLKTILTAPIRPKPFVLPFVGSHAMWFDSGNYLSAGTILQYDRAQPWTVMTALNVSQLTGMGANVIFTNVVAPPYSGYEMYLDENGKITVQLMSDYRQGMGRWIRVVGSQNVCDGNWHVVAATYDGSSKAAGIKVYVDGVQDANTTVISDNLSGSTVSSGPLIIGNQMDALNMFHFNGALDNFIVFNDVRSPFYIVAHATSANPPSVDSNTALYYALEEGAGETTVDWSSNHYNGTLADSVMWF